MFLPPLLFSAFFAVKLFLWSLPIDQLQLFLITAPLGAVYFWAVFRFYRYSLTGRAGRVGP
jgi:hypothetical protein